MLKGKTVILGVTGSIAAYKIANLASMLVKLHCDVHVIMTRNATNFIHPITFETLTNNRCLVDTFDRNFQYNVEHVALAKKADLVLVAPATANVIAKLTYGLADDMLTTTVLACTCKKIVAPAMNTRMYQNKIVQDNLKKLEMNDFEVIAPATGMLACQDVGEGKLPDAEVLLDYVLKEIAHEKDMEGMNVLVTAGPTQEAVDPVRYYQSLHRENGICSCQSLYAERGKGNTGDRSDKCTEASVCGSSPDRERQGDVRGSLQPLRRAAHCY